MERTLAIIKPDVISAGHMGEVLTAYERAGLTVVAAELMALDKAKASGFYAEHEGKPFYEGLVEFMSSGPCMPLVLEGEDAIERVRTINGATDPSQAVEGALRKRFGTTVRYNAVHGSDSPESAAREVAYFFPGL